MNEHEVAFRSILCGCILTLVLGALGCRLGYLHLGPHESARSELASTRDWTATLPVERGQIFDRNGTRNILAMDLTLQEICATPSVIVSNRMVAEATAALSTTLELPADEVAVKLNQPAREYALLKIGHPEDVSRVAALDVPGMFYRDRTVRYYPHGRFMCHALGFVNMESVGSAGIEQRFDKYLRGCSGILESKKNAKRQELYWKRRRHIPSVEGADVGLTIDQYAQFIVEEALDEVMETHHAKGAWAIVQEVATGRILALVSRPSFDLNEFRSTPLDVMLNRAIGFVYEPGSTLKTIVFSAAIEENLVTPATLIDCENGAWMHGRRLLRDYHPYGTLSVEDGLKKSSNIMAAKLSVRLGDRRFHEYLRAYGLGRCLGLELPGEESGILHPVNQWSAISGSRIAIGQGVGVTALQVLSVFCTVANGGVLMKPHIVDRVVAKDGSVLYHEEPEILNRPISPQTAMIMRRMLARVTEAGGTGRRARVPGYDVAGKTGTAQKPIPGGYSSTDHVASFVGFLPADRPEIGIIVVVDEPQPLHTGGVVAAPVFSTIAAQLVRCLDIAPSVEPLTVAKR